jgi:hypothetical protein
MAKLRKTEKYLNPQYQKLDRDLNRIPLNRSLLPKSAQYTLLVNNHVKH